MKIIAHLKYEEIFYDLNDKNNKKYRKIHSI
jgi:hypothetical protein